MVVSVRVIGTPPRRDGNKGVKGVMDGTRERGTENKKTRWDDDMVGWDDIVRENDGNGVNGDSRSNAMMWSTTIEAT